MAGPARTIFIGLDACDLDVAQQFAASGAMPTLAGLLDTAAVVETLGPLGFLVGGNWPTIYTGTTPSRHQFLCSGQVRGATYEARWVGPVSHPPPVWEWVSRAGGRVAVLDAPHAAVATDLNGVQLTEWGCHDRHAGTKSFPPSFLDEINATYGPHPIGGNETPFPHFAPCDYAHRSGPHRSVDENGALLRDLLEGHRRKAALSRDLLERGGWDLFFTVLGESHCGGHQFWKIHDPTHPWHDATVRHELGDDPLRAVYAALDATVGDLLGRADDATVYVLLSHGMRAHYDGTCVLDPVLWRLDQYASHVGRGGKFTRAADVAIGLVPARLRPRALSQAMAARRRFAGHAPIGSDGSDDIPEWVGQRRWWMQPNDSAFGSIRLNLEGREPNGRLTSKRARDAAAWLRTRLLELVNVDTGASVVSAVHYTDDHYQRVDGDPMGDLIVEWNREAPIDAVWSPATGVVSQPYNQWRTGDHDRRGLLLVTGPGITPGRRPGPMSVVDIAPTLAASLDVEVPSFDGVAHVDLVPTGAAFARRGGVHRPATPPIARRGRVTQGRRWASRSLDVNRHAWTEDFAVGLSRALHATNESTRMLRDEVDRLNPLAEIAQVGAWLRRQEVPESLLVSVVMPTRDRAERLARAIESVQRQSYPYWELLVVDDASDDGTWALLLELSESDHRVRPFHFDEQQRSSRARNHALDHAKGDVIVYLDDDNRFDPDWCKAVVWAFTEYPDTQVCYGARVVDDDLRHQGRPERSLPFVQFLPWDREGMLRSNRVDQNVIAHRPSSARLDPAIDHFSDWDLLLQLTDDVDPLRLPAVAAYYHSDDPSRLSSAFDDGAFVESTMAYVRNRAIERRNSAS
jgi:predicted AlkP superfamily phosphohydrolase/phosphomutase